MAPHSRHEEYQYLELIERILEQGEHRADRTGTGTLAIFAPPQLRFSLRDDIFPLLTTKRVFFRGVLEELLWFIKGDTNSNHLSERKVKIWDGNGSREYLDKLGFTDRKQGDLGPVYGFQWRHFGAQYIDCETDYTNQGVDQLQEVIDKIKNNPTDRRIILSAWNPKGTNQKDVVLYDKVLIINLQKTFHKWLYLLATLFVSSMYQIQRMEKDNFPVQCIRDHAIWVLVFHSTLHLMLC